MHQTTIKVFKLQTKAKSKKQHVVGYPDHHQEDHGEEP